jgi:hypothetical protein
MNRPPVEHTGRVLAVAVVFFGTLAAAGFTSDVFARLSRETVLALAVFALGFALATYALDGEVRRYVNGLLRFRKAAAKSPGGKPAAT